MTDHPAVNRLVAALAVCVAGFVSTGHAQTLAFPGAEGFGRFATGGRGGTVYHVTTTNDSGPGSFRDAVSVSGRTVVFDIGGVIDYKAPRYAPKANITIAGQTAPGDGVTIYGNGLSFSGSHNNICRFLRVREGINGTSDTDAMGIANGRDMIFDHMSVSWGRDETFSVSEDLGDSNINRITIQSTIISQGLQGHSAGGLIQTYGGVSILRSLYIDNDTRNPKVKGINEYVNNVVCNWETIGYNMGGDSAGDSYVNNFNNYFMRGQASGSSAISGGNANFHIYATNNWYDGNRNGVLDGTEMPFASYGSMDLQPVPFAYPITNAYSPLTAMKLAISDAGASFKRDTVDELMISQLTSWGLLGGTITSELIPPMNGPGLVRNGTPYPDTDGDGMPNYWESGTGSNPGVANNNDPSPSGSGYTRLEDYLNWLAEPHGVALMDTNVVVDLRQFTRGWVVVNRSPNWSVSNPINGTVALLNGYFAQFTPASGLNCTASFQFTVNDSDGSPVTRTMNLFFTPSAQSRTPIWHGDDLANNWNALGDFNWHDGISLLYQFHNGDAVTFDDSGSTNPAVNLIGSLQPGVLTVNAMKNYTFNGSGSLDGTMSLIKTNTGTLTINTTNGYTGNTIVSNGTLRVHGALAQSPVTVRSSGTIAGNGSLGNGVTILSGGVVAPGNGLGAPGTLTITNGLTESGGVTNRFDISDDPTGTTKTNDRINVVGDLNLSGVNTIRFSLLDGLAGDGVYTLITYTGNLTGGLGNLTVAGISGTLTNPPNAIAIIVSSVRPPATLVWSGDSVNNIWDNGTSINWLNDGAPDRFYFLDSVLFDGTGSTNPPVSLAGDLTPASVTVDAAVNYTFNGSGKITGTSGLTKTNSGTLTISTTNDYTGPTTIGGGTLSVSRLANGGVASGIGASTPVSSNLALNNGTLRYTGGNVGTDRGLTLNNAASIEVTSAGTTLTDNGTIVGPGTLIKTGPGTVTLTGTNSFSGGTIISNGTLALFGPSPGTITANNYSLGSGSVTFYGGTLRLYGGGIGDNNAGYGTFSRPMIVPDGVTAALITPGRYTMSSSLTGGGTLNMEANYVRGSLNGNWSAFTGTINVTAAPQAPGNGVAEFRVNNTSGYANATLILNNGVVLDRGSGSGSPPASINIGALGGTSGAVLGPGNGSSGGPAWTVGWNNRDATFAGSIRNDGSPAPLGTSVTKVGTGTWTLTGTNTHSLGTTINGGTVLVNNLGGSGLGSGAVAVNNNAALGGTGFINAAVTVNSGGTLRPGASVGSLTINSSLTLNGGSLLQFELGPTNASDKVVISGAMTSGGTLNISNVAGFGAGTYTLFTFGSRSGSLPGIGTAPPGYYYNLNTNTPGQLRLIVTLQTPPTIGNISSSSDGIVFSGSGGVSNASYFVLSSTNISLPASNWTRIATNQFDAAGGFSYTNTMNPNDPQSFYRLQLQ